MAKLLRDRGLKEINDPIQAAAKNTHEGMASWAGGGPDGKVCWECANFGAGHAAKPPKRSNKSGCHEWSRLLKNASPKKFPGTASACRYFKEA